ncbi:hypothetical protein HRG_009706 [Hirsutella rhossiliensis]|uniref:Uncharacterized protein n=1 Tax=Hirsutella rhossiliensis TaxID=111463 RepID=A0A9P8MQ47_9HYPO|nr:uncharacterized protein HRG_09706 [Hirsutella rhossiliensis]KAH0959245.1 hypothetical protein HRG_09706 [Hirsutella rhossiliensis]
MAPAGHELSGSHSRYRRSGGSIHVKDVDSIGEYLSGGREQLPPRSSCLVDDVQLLRRSLRTQSPASGGDGDPAGALGEDGVEGPRPADHDATSAYQSDNVGNATRLIDLARSASGQSAAALASTAELRAAIVTEWAFTVVTPLNRNRWNLNMEANLAFRVQDRSTMRTFISEHRWKEGLPKEEEAIMMLN